MNWKIFFTKDDRSEFGRNFCTPNRPFWGGCGWIFFGLHQWGSKAFAKRFWNWSNHFGTMEASQSRKLPKLGPKNVVLQKFLHPKIDLFGVGWSKIFRPAPKGSQSPRKIFWGIRNWFLGSVRLLESKIANFRPKNRNFWKSIWPKFLHMGVRPAPKIFSQLGSS